jgi:hypothetical protein
MLVHNQPSKKILLFSYPKFQKGLTTDANSSGINLTEIIQSFQDNPLTPKILLERAALIIALTLLFDTVSLYFDVINPIKSISDFKK